MMNVIVLLILFQLANADDQWSDWVGKGDRTYDDNWQSELTEYQAYREIEGSSGSDSIRTICVATCKQGFWISADQVCDLKVTYDSGYTSWMVNVSWGYEPYVYWSELLEISYGKEDCFTLSTDEYITSVYVYEDYSTIYNLGFQTNWGNSTLALLGLEPDGIYGPFGNKNPSQDYYDYRVNGSEWKFGADSPELRKMGVIYANVEVLLMVRFYFGDATSQIVVDGQWSDWVGAANKSLDPTWKPELTQYQTSQAIKGSSDSDSIRTICVGTCNQGFYVSSDQVCNLKVTYDSGYTSGWILNVSSEYEPYNTGKEDCFTLSTDEYITSVYHKENYDTIFMLEFTSSSGNVYGPFGSTYTPSGYGYWDYKDISGTDGQALLKMEVIYQNVPVLQRARFYFGDENENTCDSHEDCPDDDTFCNNGQHCDYCSECQYCHDGIDGTCGSCGDGYPTQESGRNCTEPVWYVIPTDIGDGANAVNGGVVAMVFGFVVLIMG